MNENYSDRARIGAMAKTAREQKGMKQVVLASEAIVSDRTIQRIEDGDHSVKVSAIKRVEAALGITLGAPAPVGMHELARRLHK